MNDRHKKQGNSMKKIEIKNINSIIHLDDMNITKIGDHDKRVKEATEAVLKNKSVYNALKRLADE